jgi:hypothetical protein
MSSGKRRPDGEAEAQRGAAQERAPDEARTRGGLLGPGGNRRKDPMPSGGSGFRRGYTQMNADEPVDHPGL